jgi:hypothetical protein
VKMVFPTDGAPVDPSWWRPLEQVMHTIAGDPRYEAVDIDDFMLMGGVARRGRPRIVLYKHVHSRRYLNLDDAGHAYGYVPPRPGASGDGRYVALEDLRTALERLDLPFIEEAVASFRRQAGDTG